MTMLEDRTRYKERQVGINHNLRISASTRDDVAGKGICISLYCNNVEVMRFDLFDELPHYHVNQSALSHRIFIRERSMDDKLERARWEIENNWGYACMTCHDGRVSNAGIQLQPDHLDRIWPEVLGHVKTNLLKQ